MTDSCQLVRKNDVALGALDSEPTHSRPVSSMIHRSIHTYPTTLHQLPLPLLFFILTPTLHLLLRL